MCGEVNTLERLFSTFDGICHQTFRASKFDVLRTVESDSDDEEEYEIKRNKFGAPIYGPKPTAYLNCNDPAKRSLALQATMGRNDAEAGSSRSKRSRQYVTMEEDILKGIGCNGEINDMLRIKLHEAESNEEIFTFVAWIRAFNIKEPIYSELCQELGLYHADELEEDGFDVYFQRGLCNDDHFNAQEYWLSISGEENLSLSRSHASTIRNPILRMVHKMITYGSCQRTTGHDKIQKNDLWLLKCFMRDTKEHFKHKIARKARVLNDVVLRSLSALIYYRYLDTTTLRELIYSKGRLIPEDPQPGVPRVGIPRPPRALMQDLYERMGNIEIRQGAIERMSYRQSYHRDRYAGVFEHMAGVFSVDLQGAYNPPGYAQPQYDQYY
ncbi:hypothetical protein Tco_0360867 [Tanacetum coccineum]